MVLIVDDDGDGLSRRWKQAPPVDPRFGRVWRKGEEGSKSRGSETDDTGSGKGNGEYFPDGVGASQARTRVPLDEMDRNSAGSVRSSSPYSFSAE